MRERRTPASRIPIRLRLRFPILTATAAVLPVPSPNAATLHVPSSATRQPCTALFASGSFSSLPARSPSSVSKRSGYRLHVCVGIRPVDISRVASRDLLLERLPVAAALPFSKSHRVCPRASSAVPSGRDALVKPATLLSVGFGKGASNDDYRTVTGCTSSGFMPDLAAISDSVRPGPCCAPSRTSWEYSPRIGTAIPRQVPVPSSETAALRGTSAL